jgi:hypothetical protein
MPCGCRSQESRIPKPRKSVMTGQGIKPCRECVVAHLLKARDLLRDAAKGKVKIQYAVIWHLASAASKTPRGNAKLRGLLLETRRNYQKDGVSPDWGAIFGLIEG